MTAYNISILPILILLLVLKDKSFYVSSANLSQAKGQSQNSPQIHQQQQTQPGVHHHAPANAPHHAQQQQQQPPSAQLQPTQQTQLSQLPQYVHEKDPMQEVFKSLGSEDDISDTYQLLNELKHEARLSSMRYPWLAYASQPAATQPPHIPLPLPLTVAPPTAHPNDGNPYESLGALHTPKFLPFFSYAQPVFIPYPFFVTPEMYYGAYASTANDVLDDTMARAASDRRPTTSSTPNPYQRNSPIFYVRMPTSPYMFLPPPPPPMPATAYSNTFPPLVPYPALPSFSPYSSVFNLPVNFLANGKPANIYQVGGSPTDIQSTLQFGGINAFGTRPPPSNNPYRPSSNNIGYLPTSSYNIPAPTPPPQDSKMTALKRPFIFNGRPEDIYILPNNFNSLYTDSGYY